MATQRKTSTMVEVKSRIALGRRGRRAGRRGDVGAALLRGERADHQRSQRRRAIAATTPTCCGESASSVAQRVGLSLGEIRTRSTRCPTHARRPRRTGRARGVVATVLDERIALLEAMKDQLDGCIGCGCLSLDTCALYNPTTWQRTAGPAPDSSSATHRPADPFAVHFG